VAVSVALCAAGDAEAQKAKGKAQAARASFPSENALRERINEWTVGLAGGLLEGRADPPRHRNRAGRQRWREFARPAIVTRGPTENVNDLLYLRGVDMAIISSDSLEEYKSQVPDIQQRLTYILNLFPSELHIFVRPEFNRSGTWPARRSTFNTQGTAAAFLAP